MPAAFGQQPIGQLPVSGEAILGFENSGAWQVTVGTPTVVTLSTVRTQGGSAFSVMNPGNQSRLNSLPVPSNAMPLTGLGAPDSTFAVDIRFPAAGNGGSLRLSLNSPSKGLNNLPLGKVAFGQLRPDTFQTIIFPIPDQARKALAGAPANDLTFQLDMSVPGGSGEYLFDNLRVRSAQVVMTDATTKPPLGYGGSVDLDLNIPTAPSGTVPVGQVSVEQTFDVGPIQIPDRFHVKAGTAGAGTSVQLDLGYSSTSLAVTCVYLPDTLDTTGKSYLFTSCTGGPQPGDIISATWVRLTVINGVPPMRILAQLARRPVGDQMGSGIIPPMPTFWGDEDKCIPLTGGPVASTSQSCGDAVAQANQIVNDYFNAVRQSSPTVGWIVLPVPEDAKRHGNGIPAGLRPVSTTLRTPNFFSPNPAAPTASFSFPQGAHLNPGGKFDAYWSALVDLGYTNFAGTDESTAHMDASFEAAGVFWGENVSALKIMASADSDTGQTTPIYKSPQTHADAGVYVFGTELSSYHSDTGGFDDDIVLADQHFDAPPIQIFIFQIKVGVAASAGLLLQGGISANGINGGVTPHATIGGHLFGGVGVPGASGGVDATVNLMDLKVPITAKLNWVPNASITSCSLNVDGSLDGTFNVSSGGGHIDLEATVGFCPACDDWSYTIFNWNGFSSGDLLLFQESIDVASFPLPDALCTGKPLKVTIGTPSGTVSGAIAYPLTGSATSYNTSNPLGDLVDCSFFAWSVDHPLDKINGTGCNATIVFDNTPHTSTITLTVNHTSTASGRQLTESGSATTTVTVTALPEGVHITSAYDLTASQFVKLNSTEPRLTANSGPAPAGYILGGVLVPPAGVDPANVKYTWTWKVTSGGTDVNITCDVLDYPEGCIHIGDSQSPFDPLKTFWGPPSDNVGFTVTLTAVDTVDNWTGSDTMQAYFYALH